MTEPTELDAERGKVLLLQKRLEAVREQRNAAMDLVEKLHAELSVKTMALEHLSALLTKANPEANEAKN